MIVYVLYAQYSMFDKKKLPEAEFSDLIGTKFRRVFFLAVLLPPSPLEQKCFILVCISKPYA